MATRCCRNARAFSLFSVPSSLSIAWLASAQTRAMFGLLICVGGERRIARIALALAHLTPSPAQAAPLRLARPAARQLDERFGGDPRVSRG